MLLVATLAAVAPGVVFLFLALGLYLALARWFDAVPPRIRWLQLGIVLLLFGKALFLGAYQLPLHILLGSQPFDTLEPPEKPGLAAHADQVEHFLPFSVASRRALGEMEWPLLNSVVGGGEPLLANPQAQAFQPLHLLTLPLPAGRAVAVISASKVLLALTFTFLFLSRLGLGHRAALAGALTFGLGGFLMMWLGWPHGHSASALPILLYALTGLRQTGQLRWEGLLVLGTLAVVLGGHPQTILIVALVAGAWALTVLWPRLSGLAPGTTACGRWPFLLRTGGSVICAGLMTLPVVLPAALSVGQTQRQSRIEAGAAKRTMAEKETNVLVRDLSDPFLPQRLRVRTSMAVAPLAFGTGQGDRYWGYQNRIEDGSQWCGSLAMLALLLALLPGGPRRRLPGELFGIGLAVAGFALTLGLPGLHRFLFGLPMMDRVLSNASRLSLPFTFGAAIVLATTVQHCMTTRPRWTRLLLATALTAAAMIWAYLYGGLPDGVSVQMQHLRWRALALHLAVLGIGTVLLALLPTRRTRPTLGFLVLLVAAELLLIHGPVQRPMPKHLYFPDTPEIEFLKANLEDPVAASDDSDSPFSLASERLVAIGYILRSNLPTVYGIPDWRSANSMQPGRSSELSAILRANEGRRREYVTRNHPLYDLFGVRYLVLRKWQRSRLPNVLRGGVAIYERPHPMPVAWLPTSLLPVDPELTMVTTQTLVEDFAEKAVVSHSDLPPAMAGTLAAQRFVFPQTDHDSIELIRVESSRLTFDTRIASSRLLATRLHHLPGWRALLDYDERLPIIESNAAFAGLFLPPGEHRLDLVYRPRGFLLGCLLAGVGFAVALLRFSHPGRRFTSS